MPIDISIVTKVKPNFLDKLKQGKRQINAPLKTAQLTNGLKLSFRTIAEAIKADTEAAKGTILRALIALEATTATDNVPTDLCIVIPPSKEGQYKLHLKEINKIVKKGDKQIAVCKFSFDGKVEQGNIYLNVAIPPTCKMKMTPTLKWLNRIGKPMGLKFEQKAPIEGAPESTMVSGNPLEMLTAQLETLKANFYAAPSQENLASFLETLNRLSNIAKRRPTRESRTLVMNWGAQYQEAAKGLKEGTIQTTETSTETTTTETTTASTAQATQETSTEEATIPSTPKAKLDELQKRQQALISKEYTIKDVMGLLAECQALRVSPTSKVAFRKDQELLKQFKLLRRDISAMLKKNADLMAEVEGRLKDPSSITKSFQVKLDGLWTTFAQTTQATESFNDILNLNTTQLGSDIKKFQQEVSAEAKGLLEASKLLKIGDGVAISEAMTGIRSGIVKLKDTMKTKMDSLQQLAQEMAKLETDFLQATEQTLQETIFGKLENLSTQFAQESNTVVIFN